MKILATLLAVCVLVVLAILVKGEGVVALLFGWIPFLARVVSTMEVDWPNAVLGTGAAVLFAIGIQWLGWSWRRTVPAENSRPWKVRWSIMLVVVVLLLFAAGLSAIGIVHQTGWLLSSENSLFDETITMFGDRTSNLKMIGNAMQMHHDCYKKLPPAGTFTPQGAMLHSWETHLLPFTSYSISTHGIDMNRSFADPSNQKYFKCIVPDFINPGFRTPQLEDDQGYGLSHYAVNEHVLAGNKSMTLAEITDGTAHTLLFGEVNTNFKPWGHPLNWRDPTIGINRSPFGFGGPPGAGDAIFTNADGSVRLVSDRISPDVLRALSTPCGNEKKTE